MAYTDPQPVTWTAPPQPRNGFGTTGFVLGLLAAIFAWIPFVGVIGWPLAILGLIFSGLGLYRVSKRQASNKGITIAGLVLSLLGLVFCIVYTVTFANAVSDVAAGPTVTVPGAAAPSGEAPVVPAGTMVDVDGLQLTSGALVDRTQYGLNSQCTAVSYKNTGSGSESYNSFDWQLLTPSGATVPATIAMKDALQSGSLIAGGSTDGEVCFNSDGAAGQYRVIYSAGLDGAQASWTTAVK